MPVSWVCDPQITPPENRTQGLTLAMTLATPNSGRSVVLEKLVVLALPSTTHGLCAALLSVLSLMARPFAWLRPVHPSRTGLHHNLMAKSGRHGCNAHAHLTSRKHDVSIKGEQRRQEFLEFLDKGKPMVKSGRKSMGLVLRSPCDRRALGFPFLCLSTFLWMPYRPALRQSLGMYRGPRARLRNSSQGSRPDTQAK